MQPRKVAKVGRRNVPARAALMRSRLKRLIGPTDASNRAGLATTDFVTELGDEICTPVNDIIGMLELLLDTELTWHQRELATAAQASADRLLALINDMLDFTLIEAGAADLRQIPFDLRHEVKAAIDAQLASAQSKDIELQLDHVAVPPALLIGDPVRIRQVIANLINHAIACTTQHQLRAEIDIAPAGGQHCRISVSVTEKGSGMRADSTAGAADEGSPPAASDTSCQPGTGLGLALAKRLADLMGGEIGIERGSHHGLKFWFSLTMPLAPHPLAGVRVLFVDVEDSSRRKLQAELARHAMRADGFDTATAALTAMAQAAAQHDAYRIAILDHQMRGIDGELLGAAIKADPALRDILLVLLSSADPGQAERLAQAGFAAFLSKPVSTPILIETLAALCAALARQEPPPFLSNTVCTTHSMDARPFAGQRILVADDNRINQQVAARMLEKLGCHVDIAANGRQAVAMHHTQHYAAILMDCQMPEFDGYQASAQIRAAEAGRRRTAIIGCSAYALQGEQQKCMAAGMDDFMLKPLRARILREVLARRLPPAAVPPATPGTSAEHDQLNAVLEIFGADFVELAALFQADSPQRIAKLQQAAADGDAAQIAKLAHALSGSTYSIGATGLAALCKELEIAAQAGLMTDINAKLMAIEKEYLRIDARLRSIVAAIHG